ncbi:MAG: hypothetical protein JEZ11_22235 [Desulfobacterales bacterium]|nr:hypothetical protein [Desulfobacterales bacterium]
MKTRPLIRFWTLWLFCFVASVGNAWGGTLFQGRQIHLSNDDGAIFSIGVTGTTAGYNFFALVENTRQESVSLGDMGYWEKIPDPPSFLRNYDLQLTVRNNARGRFLIEFTYDKDRRDIDYRIKNGEIEVALDAGAYYPTLIINSTTPTPQPEDAAVESGPAVAKHLKRYILYDFDSFDADLRRYYGKIKQLMKNRDYTHYFYYFEAANYDDYYFRTYTRPGQLDTDKMGLSLEDGTLAYYQKVLDNLKNRLGADFADQIIIVCRFGGDYAKDLKKYAADIGLGQDMVITFWTYDEIR